MPARPFRILAVALLMVLAAIAPPAAAQQVAPRITINSVPPGANVFVDGAMQGQAGPAFKVRINKGAHKIRLELEGYKALEQTVTIGNAQTLNYTMERAPARLDIKFPATNDGARGAEIFVNGQPVAGVVPLLIDLPAGRHLVEVKKPGFKVYTETVELKAGETRPVWVMMTTDVRNGSLLVAADAPQADVLIDGQPRGQAPVLIENLTEGEHLVEVRRQEPGSQPWRQTVRIVGNQQTKVMANTAPPAPQKGSLLVITSLPNAEILIDGVSRGAAGQTIELPPGPHSLKVQGKGYKAVERVVQIEPGKPQIERIDLEGDAKTRNVGMVRIVMTNPVDGAQYYINGRRIDESAALSDQGVETTAGKVIVVAKKDDYGQTTVEETLFPGETKTVTLSLRKAGDIYIASEPKGAYVKLDGQLVGTTPIVKKDQALGPHAVEISLNGYDTKTETVVIKPGEQASYSVLLTKTTAPPPNFTEIRRSLSSFSAVTNPLGTFTGDLGIGYPHYLQIRLNVGVWRKENPTLGVVGLDIGTEVRSNFYWDTDVGLTLRLQWFQRGPFALGLRTFGSAGGGARSRNSFTWELGLPITLLAGNRIKVTAQAYMQVYSDRVCPSADNIREEYAKDPVATTKFGDPRDGAEHPGDRCVGRDGGLQPIPGTMPAVYPPSYPSPIWAAAGINGLKYDPSSRDYQVDGTGVLERFTGVRGMIQAAFEAALSPNINFWAIIEGAPFQGQRHMFTDKFSGLYPIRDTPLYGRLGLTVKFTN